MDIDVWLKKIEKSWNEFLTFKEATQETIVDMNTKKLQIELPSPPSSGGFASCPSGDNDYDEAMAAWQKKVNAIILEAIPLGCKLKSSEIKEEKIVKHFAEIVIEKP